MQPPTGSRARPAEKADAYNELTALKDQVEATEWARPEPVESTPSLRGMVHSGGMACVLEYRNRRQGFSQRVPDGRTNVYRCCLVVKVLLLNS